MARRACLAIGVATVTPPKNKAARFGYLDGAAIAANAIGEWALRSGFGEDNVRVVHDEPVDGAALPVTRERVQQAVNELFPDGAAPVEHLLLAFCGHGLTDGNVGAISWLFSDSLQQKYRVVSDSFYAELQLHGVRRITLITDACREMPKDFELARLDPVRGIVVDGERAANPEFDRFASCQDGQLGYMVSDPTSAEPGKCIFSGVIADVLWGNEPSAIKDGVITTNSFGVCVRTRTAERAKTYHLTLEPQCSVDPEVAILFDVANPPQGEPALQPWPEVGKAAVMGAFPTEAVDRMMLDTFAERIGLNMTELPRSSVPILKEMVRLDTGTSTSGYKNAESKKTLTSFMNARLGADIVTESRNRASTNVRRSIVQIRPGIQGSNLMIAGDVAAIWSSSPAARGRKTAARQGFHVPRDQAGTPVLVEMADGWFIPTVPYDSLYAVLKRGANGETFQAYGSVHTARLYDVAVQAIDDFGSGKLDSRGVDLLAGNLRYLKHQDPVLGVLCAYLYRAVADFDSIRRMAFFYQSYNQPVPYDIALLGEMAVRRGDDGGFTLEVPEVAARPYAAGNGDLPNYVTRKTPAMRARIGGRCPWIGIGWDYVALAKPEFKALVEEIADYVSEVPRAGFTTLPEPVGRALVQTWHLTERCGVRGGGE